MTKQVSVVLCALALGACSTKGTTPETPEPGMQGAVMETWSMPTQRGTEATPPTRSNVPATPGTDVDEDFVGPTDLVAPDMDGTSRRDADDTGINERDRDPSRMTPLDQSNSQPDLDITQRIRQALMSDGALSFTAKNVKVITAGGKVTLRGPVKSAAERSKIEAAARSIAGDANVVNELEIEN